MKNTIIYIVRHGQSEANIGIFRGKGDSVLTEWGKGQIQQVAQDLKDIHLDAIFASDFLRAQQTAEILNTERKLAVNTSALLRERHFGSLDGKYTDDIRKRIKKALLKLSEKEKMEYKYVSDMESPAESVSRFITYLREIAIAYEGKTILVIGHGNLMRSFLVHLGWAQFDELPTGTVKNGAYIQLESDGVDFFVRKTVGVNKNLI